LHPWVVALDREDFTQLKSAKHLADEYAAAIDVIFDRGRTPILIGVLNILFSDPSFAEISGKSAMDFLREDQRRAFMSWSTGHKIVLHATIERQLVDWCVQAASSKQQQQACNRH
jgi:hypothetical protein